MGTGTAAMFDFEKKFSEHLAAFIEDEDLSDEEIEEMIPELYEKWLETPADWLCGKAPGSYYKDYAPAKLAEEMGKYVFSGMAVPEILIDGIFEKKEAVYPYLISLLLNYEGEKSAELKTAVVNLIGELGLAHPYEYYIGVISGSTEPGDFPEACATELKETQGMYVDRLIEAYESAESAYASDCFLDILSGLPYDERTYSYALEKFLFSESKKEFYASCLGKLGNPDALPFLEEEISRGDISYYEYEALRNAIEELGGEVTGERDFEGDKDYESLMREWGKDDKS